MKKGLFLKSSAKKLKAFQIASCNSGDEGCLDNSYLNTNRDHTSIKYLSPFLFIIRFNIINIGLTKKGVLCRELNLTQVLNYASMKNIVLVLLAFVSFSAFAQGGEIKGKVVDEKTSFPLGFARVMVVGTENVTQTDFDGNFSLKVEAGIHEIEITPMELSYKPFKKSGIKVFAGGVADLGTVKMGTSSQDLGVTTIEIETSGTESEDDAQQEQFEKKEISDVVSQEEITKTGASDAAAAAKNKSGVSVIGGKYVYIRGLGDRYNKTTLNGLEVPGLDPDKNAVQMDIFPSNVIGGMSVNKSFVAYMPADFAGGIIDIQIKSPSKKEAGLSASAGFVPTMHFNDEYYTYDREKGDVLGNGASDRLIPQYSASADNVDLMNSFNSTLAPYQSGSLLDYSFGGYYGNKLFVGKEGKISYTVSLDYSEKTRFYQDVEQNRLALATDADDANLIVRSTQFGDYGTNEVLVSGLAGINYKLNNHNKFKLGAIRLQNGVSKAGVFDFEAPSNNPYAAKQFNLEYNERTLTNYFVGGEHTFSDSSKWTVEWKASPTISSMQDPDVRRTRYNLSNSTAYGTEAGLPTRIWRSMNETNYAGRLDISKEFKFNDTIAKFRFGGSSTLKKREFLVETYQIGVQNLSALGMGENPDEIYESENILGSTNAPVGAGFLVQPPSSFTWKDPNQFESSSEYFAGYVSTELMFSKHLEMIAGVRVEQFTMLFTGFKAGSDDEFLIGEKMLDNLDFFPSVGLAYTLKENQKIRLSGTKTIARPSFKEMSFAAIIDPISGMTFLGGLNPIDSWDGNLVKTDIYNADARYEVLLGEGQTVSISGFYKHFINPIEIVQIASASDNFQPRNVGNAQVLGAEIEAKKRLNFISKKMDNFIANFNYTYTSSRVEMSDMVRQSKEANARTGEDVGKYRDMAGQSPYLINAGIGYEGKKDTVGFFRNTRLGVYYNVQGKTLQYVGITERPDVYSVPFHSINLTGAKKFGKKNQYKISFKATNLLNDLKENVYVSFGSEDQIFSRLMPARTFKLGFSMKF